MISRVVAALALAFLVALAPLRAAPLTVETVLGEWTDGGRANRVVPYKLYVAANRAAAHPVVIFSHGLGGNRDGAEYVLRFLAEHGYFAVAVQHTGTDTPAVFGDFPPTGPLDRGRLLEKVRALSPAAVVDRFRDIPFTIDELGRMNASDERFRGRFDMTRIGMSGHSFGALTALVIAGQGAGPGGRISVADSRIKAALAISPNKPREGDPAQAFAAIRIPTFHMTGTDDRWPTDDNVENRTVPYRNIAAADKFLLVFAGGDHGLFGGTARDLDPATDRRRLPRAHPKGLTRLLGRLSARQRRRESLPHRRQVQAGPRHRRHVRVSGPLTHHEEVAS